MDMLRINTQNARLDIIPSFKGEQRISRSDPKFKLVGDFPSIEIDKRATDREYGYRSTYDMLKEEADKGKQVVFQGIARVARDGDRMMDIRNGRPPAIPELAKRNSMPPPKTLNIGFIGASRPQINVVGGQKVEWEMGEVNIDYKPIPVKQYYTPGKVEVYLDKKVGRNVGSSINLTV